MALSTLAAGGGCEDGDRLRRIEPAVVREGSVVSVDVARDELVAMDFATPERGFVATRAGRLLATSDGGRSWRAVGPRRRFLALEFVGPRHGFALTRVATLLETRDGGRSWRFMHKFRAHGVPYQAAVQFTNAERGWVFPGGRRIYRTRDGGKSWTTLRFRCDGLAGASPTGHTTGYALCGGVPATIDQLKALYETHDDGDSWRLVARGHLCRGTSCHADGDVPLTGHADGLLFRSQRDGLMLAGRLGLYRTRDGGRHWRTTLFTDDALSIESVSWPVPRRLYALLGRAGLLMSDDGGRHWEQRYPAGVGRPQGAVSFFSATEGIGAGKGGFFRNPGAILATSDGGKTWTRRTVIRGVAIGQLVRVSPRVLWAVGTEWGREGRGRLAILRTSDGGRTWRRLAAPRGVSAATLSVPAEDLALLAPVEGRRLFRTTDGGETWTVVPADREVLGAQFVTAKLGLAIQQDGGLAHSTDGGRTWKPVRLVPPLRVVAFAYLDDRHWWLAGFSCRQRTLRVFGKPSVCIGGKQLLRTADGGRSWEAIRLRTWPGSPDFDFVTPTLGFAGNGSYRTTDGGRTWQPL